MAYAAEARSTMLGALYQYASNCIGLDAGMLNAYMGTDSSLTTIYSAA